MSTSTAHVLELNPVMDAAFLMFLISAFDLKRIERTGPFLGAGAISTSSVDCFAVPFFVLAMTVKVLSLFMTVNNYSAPFIAVLQAY